MVLSKLLGGRRTDAPKERTEADAAFALYPPRTDTGLNPLDRGSFAGRVAAFRKTHMLHPEHAKRGSLQILDLERIRLRFGLRWPSIREKAYQIIESTLNKRLGANDVYVAHGDNEVYVLMTDLTRGEAETRGSLIAADITARLCGTVPGGVALRVKTLPFNFATGLKDLTSLDQLLSRIQAYGRSVDGAELKLFQENVDRLQQRYRPTVALQKQSIERYQGDIQFREDDGSLLPPDVICPQSINGVFDAEVDKWALLNAGEHLVAKRDNKDGTKKIARFSVPLHYETLATMRFRDSLVATCRRLSERSSTDLAIEVLGVPPSMVQARIRELMAYIKPFCAEIIVRLPTTSLYADHLESCGIWAISLDLGHVDPEAAETIEKLETFTQNARQNGLRSMLVNTWSLKLSHMAYKTGIDLLNGDSFMPPVAKPGPVLAIGDK